MIAVTHNGTFHADDVVAAAILRLALGNDVTILRTRDPELIATADIAFDVGGVHDHDARRFDHHQKGGAGCRPGSDIPYSSAGLIWRWLGSQVAGTQAIANGIDEDLMVHVDAMDNGVSIGGPRSFNLSTILSAFNPTWLNDDTTEGLTIAFEKAVTVAEFVITNQIRSKTASLTASKDVAAAIASATRGVVVLHHHMPWKTAVCRSASSKFVVYPTIDGWRVQAIPVEPDSFKSRINLPKEWAGLKDQELQAVSGVPDAVFCHNGLFIGGAVTREGAVAMAHKALDSRQPIGNRQLIGLR